MYNKVIMIGRLTSTPELHKTNNDKSVARATIAVNRRYKDQNGEREADFVNMVLWGRLAETLASYATKGSLISVDGELRTRRKICDDYSTGNCRNRFFDGTFSR